MTPTRPPLALLAAGLALALSAALFAPAALAAPASLWTRCQGGEEDLSCSVPRGIATAPATAPEPGDVYLADQVGRRIVEYTAWGVLLRTWGWDVVASGPDDNGAGFEICVPASGDTCKAGVEGPGPGQFGLPQGVAVDSAGNVYVIDGSNQRVQKFDAEGHFLRMWGKGVNTGTSGNTELCTSAGPPTDVCGAGAEGTANGQFGEWGIGSYIALGPADKVWVGDKGRIQQFSSAGVYQGQITLGPGEVVQSLAVDRSSNLYAAILGKEDVRKWNSAAVEQAKVTVKEPQALAVDFSKSLYVISGAGTVSGGQEPTIRKFSASGSPQAETESWGHGEIAHSSGIAAGSACLASGADIYVSDTGATVSSAGISKLLAYGAPPLGCLRPARAPKVLSQYALSVTTSEASIGAQINPHFWNDATYQVQYATVACLGAEEWSAPCVKDRPGAPAPLGAAITDLPEASAPLALSGLAPGTEYRYRFIAQSSGGGPLSAPPASFRTYPLPAGPPSPDPCPNAARRTGSGAFLPDCRAYEMVSPLDKEGGDILAYDTPGFRPASLDQASDTGQGFTFSTFSAFGDIESKPYSPQYISTRGPGGWSTQGISPPRGVAPGGAQEGSDTEFKVFSPDLCAAWLVRDGTTAPPLAPDALQGARDLYRRSDCGVAAYEALTKVPPPERQPGQLELELQGLSANGAVALVSANDRLAPAAPTLSSVSERLLYQSDQGGGLRFICLLPGGEASNSCSAGSPSGQAPRTDGRSVSADHAISEDGSRIFWSDSSSSPGHLFVRIDGQRTVAVSEPVSGESAVFWAAAADGSKAIFSVGKPSDNNVGSFDLYEFDVASEEARLIAHEVAGVLGASEDASRIYLVSAQVLGGENAEEETATPGKPNLYLYEGGTGKFTFIATLARADAVALVNGAAHPTPVNVEPFNHSARVSPNGDTLAFMSSGSPTGYDNTDQANGEADAEVYRYSAETGQVDCLSCDPSGARPLGGELVKNPSIAELQPYYAAGVLPGWENQLYAPRALSNDGTRLFFDSFSPLALRDTNGAEDVYQWEEAGAGSCSTSSPDYSPPNGGCLSLISSGESPFDSEFIDADPEGQNVFIRTGQSLLAKDPGLFDIYDARVNGGFAEPNPPAACEGEACQSPPAPPDDPTPASSSFQGPGNVKEAKPTAKKCKKGFANKHGKCVKKAHRAKHKKRSHKRARSNRGAAR